MLTNVEKINNLADCNSEIDRIKRGMKLEKLERRQARKQIWQAVKNWRMARRNVADSRATIGQLKDRVDYLKKRDALNQTIKNLRSKM